MKSLTTLIEGAEITPEHLAKNPPKFIPPEHHELWSHLVLKKQHRTYGSAVAHFKHHTKKWGYALTLLTMSVIDEYDPLNEEYDGHLDNIHKVLDDHAKKHNYKHFVPRIMKSGFGGYHVEVDHLNKDGSFNSTSILTKSDDPNEFLKHCGYKESNDDDSAEDAEGKDGDNDGESSAEIGNSEDKGFDNKFKKRYNGRAFGHALRVHRSKEEESMSSVIERARQILGIESKQTEEESDSISEVKLPSVHGFKIGQVVKINTQHPSYDSFGMRAYGSSNYKHRKKLGLDTTKGGYKRAHGRVQLGVVIDHDRDKPDHIQVAVHRHKYGGGQNFSQAVHKDALSAVRESDIKNESDDAYEVQNNPARVAEIARKHGYKAEKSTAHFHIYTHPDGHVLVHNLHNYSTDLHGKHSGSSMPANWNLDRALASHKEDHERTESYYKKK